MVQSVVVILSTQAELGKCSSPRPLPPKSCLGGILDASPYHIIAINTLLSSLAHPLLVIINPSTTRHTIHSVWVTSSPSL